VPVVLLEAKSLGGTFRVHLEEHRRGWRDDACNEYVLDEQIGVGDPWLHESVVDLLQLREKASPGRLLGSGRSRSSSPVVKLAR